MRRQLPFKFRPTQALKPGAIMRDRTKVCTFMTDPDRDTAKIMVDALNGQVIEKGHTMWSIRNDAAVHAIEFMMNNDEGEAFMRCWMHGDFDAIREEWPEAPEDVFIGADCEHPQTIWPELYTCIGKGGEYELIGESTGAGYSCGETIMVYQDTMTGRIFHRTLIDFKTRMEKLP